MEKWASKWLELHSQRHRFSFFSEGGPTPTLILFPHLWLAPISSKLRLSTLLKIKVIEYGKMGFKMARIAFSET